MEMSDARLKIQARHVEGQLDKVQVRSCLFCEQLWPCDAVLMLCELQAAENERDDLKAAVGMTEGQRHWVLCSKVATLQAQLAAANGLAENYRKQLQVSNDQLAAAQERVRELEACIPYDVAALRKKVTALRTALDSAPVGVAGETHGDVVARYYKWYETTRQAALSAATDTGDEAQGGHHG